MEHTHLPAAHLFAVLLFERLALVWLVQAGRCIGEVAQLAAPASAALPAGVLFFEVHPLPAAGPGLASHSDPPPTTWVRWAGYSPGACPHRWPPLPTPVPLARHASRHVVRHVFMTALILGALLGFTMKLGECLCPLHSAGGAATARWCEPRDHYLVGSLQPKGSAPPSVLTSLLTTMPVDRCAGGKLRQGGEPRDHRAEDGQGRQAAQARPHDLRQLAKGKGAAARPLHAPSHLLLSPANSGNP